MLKGIKLKPGEGKNFILFGPFKIDCMSCVRNFVKSYARVRKQNTQHENYTEFSRF